MQKKPVLKVFDLDRTVTRIPTYTLFLILSALRIRPWRLPAFIFVFPFMLAYKLGLVDRRGLKQIMHWLLLGSSLDRRTVDKVANDFADRVLARHVYPQALEMIRTALADGSRVILATASYEFYVSAIARRLGVSEVVATKSRWVGDRLTHRVDGPNCYGWSKFEMLRDYFRRSDTILNDNYVIFYSDHISDRPVFEFVDEPVATNPSTKLRKLAALRGWKVVEWR